jgi:hypothetical protein
LEQYNEKKRKLLSYKTKIDLQNSIIPLKGTKNSGYSPDTGERFRIERELDIERKKKFARINSNKKQNKFTNTNMDEIDYICQHLTNAQIGYLMILQCYINYDGRLIRSQKDKTPLKTSEMRHNLGLVSEEKKKTFYNFINNCLAVEILELNKKEKVYSVNRKFIFKGAFRGMNVVSIVTKEIKDGLKTAKPEELAMIFKLQKFVNFRTMALVNNPDETDLNKLEFLKAKDLAEYLGVTPSYLSQKLYRIVINNEYVVARVKTGKGPAKFMLNPNIFFRGDYAQIKENIAVDVAPFFKGK